MTVIAKNDTRHFVVEVVAQYPISDYRLLFEITVRSAQVEFTKFKDCFCEDVSEPFLVVMYDNASTITSEACLTHVTCSLKLWNSPTWEDTRSTDRL